MIAALLILAYVAVGIFVAKRVARIESMRWDPEDETDLFALGGIALGWPLMVLMGAVMLLGRALMGRR